MNKKAYAFFLKKNRPRNKVAQQLSDGRYHQRVVKNKKAYDRKKNKMDPCKIAFITEALEGFTVQELQFLLSPIRYKPYHFVVCPVYFVLC